MYGAEFGDEIEFDWGDNGYSDYADNTWTHDYIYDGTKYHRSQSVTIDLDGLDF